MINYSGMATPLLPLSHKGVGAPMPLLLLYHHCGIVPITAALHIKSSAKIKLTKGKLLDTALCFLWWERKVISNQGEYKVENIMIKAPNFSSECSLKAFKTLL